VAGGGEFEEVVGAGRPRGPGEHLPVEGVADGGEVEPARVPDPAPSRPGAWPTDGQREELTALAGDLAARRSWYRRTVVLDALEYLHRHR
jgi:hypothetical protein